ncbi:hypothetical protein TCAL_10508 [Tigriopus californicus]|uniref:60S ribosomal export protein NMD3 n=1 Tax=Tigriopus californicus TaxID=6832 RepID=A0A553P4D4_TIGCA|nr:hypothetical protein TCAL_10508 [Tigriopus californicus]
MEYLPSVAPIGPEQHKILCCQCGVPILPNPSSTCVQCLRTQVDLSADIPKSIILQFCKFCERYLNPPNQWVVAGLESRELMALCLKKIKNLAKVRLVDASFIWTEPHSKRLKGEIDGGTILQQTFVVEYVIHFQMCDDCRRVEAKDTWNSSVQLRQKSDQKKTLYYLEQLLMKYDATRDCSGIKASPDGLDFFFSSESSARKLTEFLTSMIPIRSQSAKKLISHDAKSNIYNYKYTTCVEVVPICKDNIVCLPPALAHSLGGIGQICVVYKVSHLLHLIDPNTGQFAEMNAASYFKNPFLSLIRPRNLVEYTVINVEIIREHERRKFSGQGQVSKKHILADVWVTKSSELGMNDDTVHCRSHLGHLLQVGDAVMGFDLKNSNVNDKYLEKIHADRLPDVVLVKKVFGDKSLRNRKRKWRLKHMEGLHQDTASQNEEYCTFLEDLEEDPDLRRNVNVYKDIRKVTVDETDSESGDVPKISLAEMLDEMTLTPVGDDATGGDGAQMDE